MKYHPILKTILTPEYDIERIFLNNKFYSMFLFTSIPKYQFCFAIEILTIVN